MSGGRGFEPPWKSRRVWAAALTFGAVILGVTFPEHKEVIAPILTALAGFVGLTSWTFPK